MEDSPPKEVLKERLAAALRAKARAEADQSGGNQQKVLEAIEAEKKSTCTDGDFQVDVVCGRARSRAALRCALCHVCA